MRSPKKSLLLQSSWELLLIVSLDGRGVFIKAIVLLGFILFFDCLELQAGWKSHMLLWSLWAKKKTKHVGSNLCEAKCSPSHSRSGLPPAAIHCYTSRQSLLSPQPHPCIALPRWTLIFFLFIPFNYALLTLREPIVPNFSVLLVVLFISQKHSFCSIPAYRLAYISFRLRIFPLSSPILFFFLTRPPPAFDTVEALHSRTYFLSKMGSLLFWYHILSDLFTESFSFKL